jgi:spoIIIJ-associated protein
MENQQIKERLKKFIEKVLEKANFSDCEVCVVEEESTPVIFDIRSESSANRLIGQNGENLRALQYIVRLLVRKHFEEDFKMPFIIDINGYRKQKDEAIFALVDNATKQVIQEKKAITLRPMTPYERRLVHVRLAENDQVITESIGEREERKVVIKLNNSFNEK